MDIVKLKYFYTTAKLENMTLASKELLISQPALSKSIANLETELGMELFLRKDKRIELNDNGKFLFERIKRIFGEIDHLEHALAERIETNGGHLSVVATLPYTFSNIIDSFLDHYPDLNCQQVSLSKSNIKEFIDNRKYDICITTEKIEHLNVEWIPLFEESIYLTIPKAYKEAHATSIDLTKLDESIPYIGLTSQYKFRQFTDDKCDAIGYAPNYRIEVEEATTILQLVKSGRGVSFTPETSINPQHDTISHLRIENEPFKRTIGLLVHKYNFKTQVTEAFVQHYIDYFNRMKNS